MKKSDREIMEILEAFDATGCAHSAAGLVADSAWVNRQLVTAAEHLSPRQWGGRMQPRPLNVGRSRPSDPEHDRTGAPVAAAQSAPGPRRHARGHPSSHCQSTHTSVAH